MNKLLLVPLLSFTLVACSSTYPVRGEFLADNEHFIGTATSGLSGGKLIVTTENQVRCEGEYESKMTFSMATAVIADGEFTCDGAIRLAPLVESQRRLAFWFNLANNES